MPRKVTLKSAGKMTQRKRRGETNSSRKWWAVRAYVFHHKRQNRKCVCGMRCDCFWCSDVSFSSFHIFFSTRTSPFAAINFVGKYLTFIHRWPTSFCCSLYHSLSLHRLPFVFEKTPQSTHIRFIFASRLRNKNSCQSIRDARNKFVRHKRAPKSIPCEIQISLIQHLISEAENCNFIGVRRELLR